MRPSTSTIWSGLGGRLQSWLRRSIAQPGCWRVLADDGRKRGHSDPEDSAFGSRCDLSRVISDCESIRRDTPVFLAHLGLPSKRAQPHCREDCHVCVWHPGGLHVLWTLRAQFFWNLAAGAENCW